MRDITSETHLKLIVLSADVRGNRSVAITKGGSRRYGRGKKHLMLYSWVLYSPRGAGVGCGNYGVGAEIGSGVHRSCRHRSRKCRDRDRIRGCRCRRRRRMCRGRTCVGGQRQWEWHRVWKEKQTEKDGAGVWKEKQTGKDGTRSKALQGELRRARSDSFVIRLCVLGAST